jgi:predicted PurR-regulated permease PerM
MALNKVELSSRSIVKAILWVLIFYGLYYFKSLIFVLFISVIMASVADRIAVFTKKKIKLPRALSISILYLLFVGITFLVLYTFIPTLVNYLAETIKELPRLLDSFKSIHTNSDSWYSNFLSYIINAANNVDTNALILNTKNWVFKTSVASSASIFNFVLNFVLTFVISFYIALSEKGVSNFLRLISPKKYEDYIVSLFERTQKKISGWFFGQILVAFIVAVLVYIVLLILNIPFALYIALLAFVFEIMPIAGVTTSSIPALFFAWNIGGYYLMLITLICFLVISQISSYILYPKIVGKFVGIPTVVIIIAVVVGAEVAGFWGVLISIPVATIVVELLQDFKKLKEEQI